MFKCQQCKKVSKSGSKQHKIVVKSRQKTYTNKVKKTKEEQNESTDHKSKQDEFVLKQTYGHEIVKEVAICEKCHVA